MLKRQAREFRNPANSVLDVDVATVVRLSVRRSRACASVLALCSRQEVTDYRREFENLEAVRRQ
jgi:hypothetical protein